MKILALTLVALLLFSGSGKAETLAITDGKLITLGPDGTIENGTLLIENGRISAVGSTLDIPLDATVIDANGKWVTPGIFAALSQLGVVEIELEESTDDTSVEDSGFNAGFDISYAINPRAVPIAVTRMEGVTRAGVMPAKGDAIFAGLGALIHLGDAKDLVTHPRAFMAMSLGASGGNEAGGSRAGAVVAFLDALEEALRFRDDPEPDDWDGTIPRLDAEALIPVAEGRVPLIINLDRASDITQVIKLAARLPDLRVVIQGAGEGWIVAEDLAAAEIPVIIQPLENLPRRFDSLAQTRHNAERLVAAGVTVAFAQGWDGHNPRLLLQQAGNAVAHGLAWEEAVKAITLNPARIFGVDDDLGSLAVGKIGDLVIWDGDPLEVMSSPDAVIIEGVTVPMESRQTKLRDRYRDLNRDWPFAYER